MMDRREDRSGRVTDQSNHPPAWKPLAVTVIAGISTAGRSNDFKFGSRRCLELTVNDSIGRQLIVLSVERDLDLVSYELAGHVWR